MELSKFDFEDLDWIALQRKNSFAPKDPTHYHIVCVDCRSHFGTFDYHDRIFWEETHRQVHGFEDHRILKWRTKGAPDEP